MTRVVHAISVFSVVLLLAGCQSSGLKQSFQGELPIDGKLVFSN